MIPRSLVSFVSRLRRETDDGVIQWIEGAEDSFVCNSNQYTITVSYHFDDDRQTPVYRLNMLSRGKSAGFVVTGDEEDVDEMRNLFSSAAVSAGGFGNIEKDFFA